MERSFSDRIQADINRGKMVSVDDEERAQLEQWITSGLPVQGGLAARYRDSDRSP